MKHFHRVLIPLTVYCIWVWRSNTSKLNGPDMRRFRWIKQCNILVTIYGQLNTGVIYHLDYHLSNEKIWHSWHHAFPCLSLRIAEYIIWLPQKLCIHINNHNLMLIKPWVLFQPMVPQDIIRYIMVKYAPYVILTFYIQKSWVNISSGAWWYYDITWTSVESSAKVFCDIHRSATSQETFIYLICNMCSETALLKLIQYFTGATSLCNTLHNLRNSSSYIHLFSLVQEGPTMHLKT